MGWREIFAKKVLPLFDWNHGGHGEHGDRFDELNQKPFAKSGAISGEVAARRG